MNKILIFGFTIIIFSLFFINPIYSQEPEPPKIPEPSPEPRPIEIPEPELIRQPFPEESDVEKIQRLKSQQVDDKKQVLDMISKLADDPEKFKEILKKSKSEN